MDRPRLLGLTAALCCGCAACGPSGRPAHEAPARQRDELPATLPADPAPTGRLGDKITPREYHLELEVDPSDALFRGRVRIEIDIAEPVSSFWLHSSGLTIAKSVLRVGDDADTDTIALTELPAPEDSGLLGLSAARTVAPGRALLEIEYAGAMRQQTGLFRQEHDDAWYAITDFEPVDARLAVPCFDDPRFKVPWNLSLIVPRDLAAFANAPQTGEEDLPNGDKRVLFARTRPVPTYLVAFAVGPFEVVEAPGSPVPMRILALRGKSAWAGYAKRHAPALLRELAGYFGGSVPFPKLDFVAVPSFSGAMENPGLITVSASILLHDPARPSIGQQRLAALVLAHELVHLWLGDLVTMQFWDDLWLNEGSATWLAARILDRWNPAQKWTVHEVASTLEGMSADSLLDAPPIRHAIADTEDVRSAFDPISYKKGGALFTMLEAQYGAKRFRAHIRNYVAKHTDGNVSDRDLIAALPAEPGNDPARWLRTFLDQPGLPEVEARLVCSADDARIALRQSRYFPLAAKKQAGAAHRAQRWRIPLCVRYGDRKGVRRACTTLADAADSIALPRCPRWIYPNADELGYYRVKLQADQLEALARLAPSALTEREVVGLTGNLVAMLTSGSTEIAAAMPLLGTVARERNLAATRLIAAALTSIERAVITDRSRKSYAAYVRRLYAKRARVLGFRVIAGEEEETTLMRPIVLALAGRLGRDPWTLARAKRLTLEWLDTGQGIAPSLLRTVLSTAASAGDERLFERMEQALGATDATTRAGRRRRLVLLAALGSFAQPALLRRAVELVLDRGATPPDLTFLFEAIFRNQRAGRLGFDLLTETQAHLKSSRGGEHALRRTTYLALLVGQRACSPAELAEVERMVEVSAGKDQPDWLVEAVDETRREVAECSAFRAHHQAGADAFFR